MPANRRRDARAWRVLAATILLLGQTLATPPATTAAEVTTTVTLTASANPTNRGEFFTLEATVTPNPGGGGVTFYDVGADECLCSYPVDPGTGIADASVGLFDLGERELKAVFSGHGEFAASGPGPTPSATDRSRRTGHRSSCRPWATGSSRRPWSGPRPWRDRRRLQPTSRVRPILVMPPLRVSAKSWRKQSWAEWSGQAGAPAWPLNAPAECIGHKVADTRNTRMPTGSRRAAMSPAASGGHSVEP